MVQFAYHIQVNVSSAEGSEEGAETEEDVPKAVDLDTMWVIMEGIHSTL